MSATTNSWARGNDVLVGKGGDDTLFGEDGIDFINGGRGADVMVGGLGNDTYTVDSLRDTVDEESFGGAGIDTVVSFIAYRLENNPRILGSVENLSLAGAAVIDGSGNALANVVRGNSANNILNGRAGSDTLTGGDGKDTFVFDIVPGSEAASTPSPISSSGWTKSASRTRPSPAWRGPFCPACNSHLADPWPQPRRPPPSFTTSRRATSSSMPMARGLDQRSCSPRSRRGSCYPVRLLRHLKLPQRKRAPP